jgi:hypothetical protein
LGFGSEITEHLVHYIIRIEPIADLVPVLQNPNILQASFLLDLESISEIVDWLQVNTAAHFRCQNKVHFNRFFVLHPQTCFKFGMIFASFGNSKIP